MCICVYYISYIEYIVTFQTQMWIFGLLYNIWPSEISVTHICVILTKETVSILTRFEKTEKLVSHVYVHVMYTDTYTYKTYTDKIQIKYRYR